MKNFIVERSKLLTFYKIPLGAWLFVSSEIWTQIYSFFFTHFKNVTAKDNCKCVLAAEYVFCQT